MVISRSTNIQSAFCNLFATIKATWCEMHMHFFDMGGVYYNNVCKGSCQNNLKGVCAEFGVE